MSNSIAAIIPTFRRWPYLLDTVEQLLSQTRVPDEIIIVDQTPEDAIEPEEWEHLELLQSRHPRIIYERQEEPLVYRARNRAAQLASADLLLYLDDDVVLDEELVYHHSEILKDDSIDAVAGYTVKEGQDEVVPSPDLDVTSPEFAFRFAPRAPERIEGISYCSANHFCIRRSVLIDVGGWDEHILTYGDKEMSLRLASLGKKIVYDPRPKMTHLAVPRGGTRLSDKKAPWKPWQRAVSIHYLALKYLSGSMFVRQGLLKAARHTFLLKKNAIRPWRWPPEIFGWLKGYFIAVGWVKKGTKSPFV
jgi:GT2 family glycosyltransferase